MEELVLMDLIERYLGGQLTPQERDQFEQLRRSNPEVDQLVVEQQMFLGQLEHYGQRREMKHQLHLVHNHLLENGAISETVSENKGAKVIQFWNKYKRTITVAASIAGVTALLISGTIHLFTPKPNETYLQPLFKKMSDLERNQKVQDQKIHQIITQPEDAPVGPQKSVGTSFLIDAEGYLVTNFHVVNDATTLRVVNKGNEYIAKRVYTDEANDIAILRIEDKDWKPAGPLPYGIRKGGVDLGEEIFTLGFPRNQIVYNRGYLSASSGYLDDSLSIQLSISANPGNSGGPVLDKNGDIIGILSTRDKQSNDVVFATKSVNINRAIEELKKDTAYKTVSIPAGSRIKGVDRVQQIKKIQDCVFMVKGY
jgi:serine protease Do